MRRFEDDTDNWYTRRRLAMAKFAIAREKLKSEVDMKEIIVFNRVSKFLHRFHSTKRQRASVAHFKRYTIQDKEVLDPRP